MASTSSTCGEAADNRELFDGDGGGLVQPFVTTVIAEMPDFPNPDPHAVKVAREEARNGRGSDIDAILDELARPDGLIRLAEAKAAFRHRR